MTFDLFQLVNNGESWTEELCPGAVVLRQYATPQTTEVLQAIDQVVERVPFRHMQMPGGFTMSAALSSCGAYGWLSDRRGYRYSAVNPKNGLPWPDMPVVLRDLAVSAAAEAGFLGFNPDACLINCYVPGAKMSLHQDKNEGDFTAPIVSLSLGVPAMFVFGGMARSDKTLKVPLMHGDVVVWGGGARLYFHGVLPIKEDYHPLLGNVRLNVTFRKVDR